MQKKIQIFMEQYHMIENGDHVVAGVSGGADSVCLLRVLCELRECMGFSLSAVHVEHGIRGAESLSDAAFVSWMKDFMRHAVSWGQIVWRWAIT